MGQLVRTKSAGQMQKPNNNIPAPNLKETYKRVVNRTNSNSFTAAPSNKGGVPSVPGSTSFIPKNAGKEGPSTMLQTDSLIIN